LSISVEIALLPYSKFIYFTTKNTKIAKINFFDRMNRINRIKTKPSNPKNPVNPVEKSPLRPSASAGKSTRPFIPGVLPTATANCRLLLVPCGIDKAFILASQLVAERVGHADGIVFTSGMLLVAPACHVLNLREQGTGLFA